jgi:hypothetical protein
MLVFKGKDLPIPVLENSTYSNSLESYKNNAKCRFTITAKMMEKFNLETKPSIIDYSFSILDSVALDGSWSIVYDIKNMKIYFKTSSNRNLQTVNINSFDFDCTSKSLIYDLKLKNKVNISNLFITFNSELNKDKLNDAIKTNNIELPDEVIERFRNYNLECKCLN